MSGKPTVAVLGSCITRDVFNSRFNPDWRDHWDCVLGQNQSSVVAMMSRAVEAAPEVIGDVPAYRAEVVRSDLTKSFLDRVTELAPDYVVLDFFADVHFGVLDLGDDVMVTNNRWHLHKTPFFRDLKAAGPLSPVRWQQDPDAYVELWKSAFDQLVVLLRARLPQTVLVVHHGFNTAKVLLTGEDRVIPLREYKKVHPLNVRRANQVWRRLDAYAAAVPGVESIDLTSGRYTSFDQHPWGPFYVHYTLDYYRDFLAALDLLHVRRRLADLGLSHEAALLESAVDGLESRSKEEVERLRRKLARERVRTRRARQEVARYADETAGQTLRRLVRRGRPG